MKQKTLLALAVGTALAAPIAEARITEVKITTRDTAFGGYAWPVDHFK